MQPPRWKTITQSQYEWERRALDFLREGLPDHDPYRAWSNFEFQTKDGAIYEVDLLVLTKQGFWLIEIKSWPGRVRGDVGTWTREHEGRIVSEDNPLLLTNRKVKALKSLLSGQPSAKRVKIPWLEAVIFLSDEELKCDLTGPARNRVFLRDRDATGDKPARNGILKAVLNRDGQGIDSAPSSKIDIRVAKAVARAIEESGIRPSQKSRRVGDYILGDLIADGPGYQDRLAKHAAFETQEVYSRVRQYTVAQAATEETRKKLKRAAAREFQIIQTLNHPGILPVLDYKDHELGPALLFRYTDPHAERLDHYLARTAKSLDTDQRLDLLRQIADAVRYAHSRRVVHRALAPQSVLVSDANAKHPTLQLYNWQVGYQQSSNVTATVTNIDDLVEAQSLVYMAPEALADPKKVSQASDIFSLGAIAFHLFAGRPPANNLNEMTQILQKRSGFSISSVVDGVGPRLEELIHWSTHKDALTRIGSVDEFLTFLADVEDELTAPDTSEVIDPLTAKRGNRLEHDYEVVRVLGQGATARALLVRKNEKEFVWKVALTEDDNRRLQDEARALDTIHSEFVIKIHDTLEVAGKTVLVLQKAGENSLAKHLRKFGVPSLDLLARYGENLLSAVKSLETHGIVHRDIKPDNIGIHSVNKQQNQLILYDFSLTSAPLENLQVGTPGYTDPFLKNRKSGKWDLAAERYSAAVTLYEMTLGDGQLPQWGDGSTDPAMNDAELVLEEEKFKPSVREGLVKFFRKALHRDSEQRFDNATDMLTEWLLIFKNADSQTVTTSTGEEVKTSVPIEDVELSTAIAALDLSAPARDALEAINLISVEDLLRYRTNDIHMMRGVGGQYRGEIIGFITELREKFPDIQAKTTSVTDDDTVPGLERLHDRVVGKRDTKKKSDWNIRNGLLNTSSTLGPTAWPSQAEVADAHDVTRAKVGQVLASDLKRWAKDSHLNAFRTDLFEQLQRLGGAATVEDLIELTIMLRPSADSLTEDIERRFASTVLRAAIESESSLSKPRYTVRRLAADSTTPELILIVATGHLDTNASSVDELSHADELSDYAATLGTVADRVAQTDPLLPRLRVFQELYDVPQPPPVPGCQPFSNDRLIKLAAAMSITAAVSSRQELYPRDMKALRALRLGIGALSGLGLGSGEGEKNRGFTIEQVLDRVNSRYPEATSLPTDAKQLESMLQQVGLDVRWDASDEVFRRRETTILMTSGSSVGSRRSTATSTRHVDSSSPETVAARQTEDRLQHAYRDGGFLVLTVKPRYLRASEQNLLRRFPELERVSFDSLLLAQARTKSVEYEFPWSNLYETDAEGPGSEEWHNLLHLMSEVTFHNKGSTVDQHGARQRTSPFEDFYEFTGTGLKSFPVTESQPLTLAKCLDKLATESTKLLPDALVARATPTRGSLEAAEHQFNSLRLQMIALQEELDWQCYGLYGLIDHKIREEQTLFAEDLSGDFHGLLLGQRAFEIVMARKMASGELETTWFARHGSTPITELPNDWPDEYQAMVERRIEVIQNCKEIRLIEKPEFKRRWNTESWEDQQQRALRGWLLDRLETAKYKKYTKEGMEVFSVAQMADLAASDAEFMQVAAIYQGRDDFELASLLAELVASESVPLLPVLRYKTPGLRKRQQWEETWQLQRREDVGEDVGDIPVPPKYKSSDFLKTDYWRLRGKLDVPKERWISFPNCGTESDSSLVVGWAGWNHVQQATAIVAYYDARKRDGWTAERLTPLLACLDQLLPWIHQWHPEVDPEYNETPGTSFQTLLESEAQELGLTLDDIRNWTPPKKKAVKKQPRKKK